MRVFIGMILGASFYAMVESSNSKKEFNCIKEKRPKVYFESKGKWGEGELTMMNGRRYCK